MTAYDYVREFHEIYDQPIRAIPNVDVPEKELRLLLIEEEFITELDTAMLNSDTVEIFDALGDTVYVCYGAGLTFGIDLRRFFAFEDFDYIDLDRREMYARLKQAFESEDVIAVAHWLAEIVTYCYHTADARGFDLDVILAFIHESNLSKLDRDGMPIFNAVRKVIKGPDFFPPTPKIKEYLGV